MQICKLSHFSRWRLAISFLSCRSLHLQNNGHNDLKLLRWIEYISIARCFLIILWRVELPVFFTFEMMRGARQLKLSRIRRCLSARLLKSADGNLKSNSRRPSMQLVFGRWKLQTFLCDLLETEFEWCFRGLKQAVPAKFSTWPSLLWQAFNFFVTRCKSLRNSRDCF